MLLILCLGDITEQILKKISKFFFDRFLHVLSKNFNDKHLQVT